MTVYFALYERPYGTRSPAQKALEYSALLHVALESLRSFEDRRNPHRIILLSAVPGLSAEAARVVEKHAGEVHFLPPWFLRLAERLYCTWDRSGVCEDLTIGTYFRLYPLLTEREFLYLDPDVCVFSSLNELSRLSRAAVYIRYDTRMYPAVLRINTGVIWQTRQWLTLRSVEALLGRRRTYARFDQDILEDLLTVRLHDAPEVLGLLPAAYNYRDRYHFRGAIVGRVQSGSHQLPIGLDEEGHPIPIRILHYGSPCTRAVFENHFVQQFLYSHAPSRAVGD